MASPSVDPGPRQGRLRALVRALAFCCAAAAFGAYVFGGLALGASYASTALARSQESGGLGTTIGLNLASSSFPLSSVILPANPIVESPLLFIPDWKGNERITVLLLGVDQRQEEAERGIPTRSDTLIVVSVDPAQRTATMISFPRDLVVTIPGLGDERINVAYPYGEMRRVEGGGPALAARTLETNFGLRPSYYAIVDFRGFEDVVKTLGGVVVDVPRPMRDNEYPTDDYNIERIYFAPGPQLMDGPTALKYVRTRHADSDFGRMARQQQVLLALRERALRPGVLLQLPTLVEQAARTVQTNFTAGEILSLAKLAMQLEPGALGSLVIDHQLVTPFRGYGGASLQRPKKDEIRRAIQSAFADPRLVREAAKIEVASAPNTAGLVQPTADHLSGNGLQVVKRTTTLPEDGRATRVVVYVDKPRSVHAILSSLALPEIAVETADGPADVDIRVILGPAFQIPTGES